MKKIIIINIALIILISFGIFVSSFGGTGSGTLGDPYQITSWAQLQEMKINLDSYFILMNNLDSDSTGYDTYASSSANGGAGWLPIGNTTSEFEGNFNGQGNTISDLYINRPGAPYLTGGLFGEINELSEIKNIGLIDINFTVYWGGGLVGAIFSYPASTPIINNSYTTGTIIGSVTGEGSLGGLVGYMDGGQIINSWSSVDILIDSDQDDSAGNGGLVGGMDFIGDEAIFNCYSYGYIESSAYPSPDIGGLVGFGDSGSIVNSYWDINISNQTTSAGGTGKTTIQMNNISTFNDTSTVGLNTTWDIVLIENWISEIWFINDGNDYPRLFFEDWFSPQITLVEPQQKNYATNISLELNYTITDDSVIDSCWYNLKNSTNYLLIDNLTILNCANTTFNVSQGSGIYNLTLYSNDSLGNENSESVNFGVVLEAPAIILNYPTDNIYLNNEIVYFNFTATDLGGLDTCELWGNWTGTWHKNYTWVSPESGVMNWTTQNITDSLSVWNVWCNDTNGFNNFALNNFTLGIDTVFPSLTLDYITTTTGTQTFVFNSTTSDENDLTCKYSIFDLAGGIDSTNENVTFVCNNETSAITSSYGTYNLTIYSTDQAGNENSSTLQFTTSASSGETVLGGGGSTTTIIEGNLAWTMEVAPGIALYEIFMPVKSSRELGINFENLGGTSVNIELSCEDLIGNACQYVEFEEQNFELPLLKDTKTKATFTIILPDDAKEGDYQFNIRAKDQNGRNGVISVKLGIETSLLSNLRKLTLSTEGGIPYALFSIGILIVSIFIFSFGLPTKTFGKNLKPILVIVISLALSILPLYLI